jgi:hypothetical protein
MRFIIADSLDIIPKQCFYQVPIIVLRINEGYLLFKNVTMMSKEIIVQVIANFETYQPLIMVDIDDSVDDVDWVKEGF